MHAPVRILQIVNIMDRAGLETMLMNHYRAIDRGEVQFDFLTHRQQRGAYEDEIEALGGRVYRAPRLYPQHAISYRRFMRHFFVEHHYPVVHSHIDAMSLFPLAAARSAGVAVRIAHSHNDSVDRDAKYPVKEWARKRLPDVATHYWACSESAGSFLFGEDNLSKVHIIKNAIELEKFRFDQAARRSVRSELGIADNQLVIGHVGRFSAVKNHSFLVGLLAELRSEGEDAALVLVGDGELRKEIETEVGRRGLSNYVHFLGLRSDVEVILQGFDAFVFPSIHEGIPLALIEAQASGVPVVTSESVSEEALVLSNTARLSLDAPMYEWANLVMHLARSGRAKNPIDRLTDKGYEIHASARSLADIYLSLYHGVTS